MDRQQTVEMGLGLQEKFFENKIICNSNKDRFRPKSGLLHHLKRVGH